MRESYFGDICAEIDEKLAEIEGEIARQDAEERARDDAGRLKDKEIERLRAELAEARGAPSSPRSEIRPMVGETPMPPGDAP